MEYNRPRTALEAARLLARAGAAGAILAGGTDLIVQMRQRQAAPGTLVSLADVAGLGGIEDQPDGSLCLGAMVRLADLAADGRIGRRYPILAAAAGHIGSPEIRNQATLGGNICNADAAADLVPPLMALDATVCILSPSGAVREASLTEFITGDRRTSLAPGELVTTVRLPPAAGARQGYARFGHRQSMSVAVSTAACSLELAADGQCSAARLALGAAVAPPRLAAAAAQLAGRHVDRAAVAGLADEVAAALQPKPDIGFSPAYLRRITAVMVRRAFHHAMGWEDEA